MIGLKNSYEIAYNGTENECRFELYADTAADLQGLTHFDGIKIQMGSECADIATGDKYILNGSGVWVLQPSDNAWQNVYTKAEIDTMINAIYQTMMYYHTSQESDDGTITFYTLGTPVGSLTIYGNGEQTGTPAPAAPITPEFVGTLDGADWTIPITCAGQTVPVYLGEVPTVRRIKKLVLTGQENIPNNDGVSYNSTFSTDRFVFGIDKSPESNGTDNIIVCTHIAFYAQVWAATTRTGCCIYCSRNTMQLHLRFDNGTLGIEQTDTNEERTAKLKTYLAAQYAAGHPVTIWYVLAKPETGIVNEPLAKIVDYADELHLTDADITIPTVSGENTLTVDTTLSPSKIIISGG